MIATALAGQNSAYGRLAFPRLTPMPLTPTPNPIRWSVAVDLNVIQSRWGISGPWDPKPLTFGTNNIVLRLGTPTGVYVLRIYSNTSDMARLRFERDVLTQLAEARLPFALPVPLATLDGVYAIETESERGAVLATLTPYIPGQPPDRDNLDQATAAGEALGHLTG